MPRALRLLVALAVGASALVAVGAATPAQADPFDDLISKAQAEVNAAEAAAHEQANKLAAAKEQQAAVQAQITAVQQQIVAAQQQVIQLRAEVKHLRKVVRVRAAALYRNGGPATDDAAIPDDISLRSVRRQRLTAAASKFDDNTMKQLDATVTQLKETEKQLAVEQQQLAVQQQQLATIEAQLVSQQAELDRRVAIANAALTRAQQIGALRARGEPVLGPTILTAAQMAGWWRTRNYSFRVPGTSIDALAQIFVEEGTAETVRGDLAFAQSIVETAGFSAAPANNFAGMGWCDSCSTGRRFPTARDGVRAQIQHLKNYADRSSRASGLHNPPSPYWYGSNPATAAHNFDTFFAKGWAPTWNDMGHGNWATSKTYSSAILKVYADMVAYAQAHG